MTCATNVDHLRFSFIVPTEEETLLFLNNHFKTSYIRDNSSAYCSQEDRKHALQECRTVISPNLRLTMQNGPQNLAEFKRAFMSEETDAKIQYPTILQDPGQRSDRENNSGARPDYMADGGRQFAEARIAEEMWYVTS
ncbi:unnamed protein product [Caretta caretta]